jgi:hypothetical protein
MLYTERKNDDNTVINDITNGEGGGSIFPIITEKKQKDFEESCIKTGIASVESECGVPCICGYYGRACNQMDDKADRFLCIGCALAEFSKAN